MAFTSTEFLALYLATFALYYLPFCRRFQIPILIGASFVFYAWSSPALLILLLASILINAITSYQVAYATDQRRRLVWATAGVIINLSILGLFKYGALLTDLALSIGQSSQTPVDGVLALLLHLPLPIGISFYTFEGISLVVDVLRKREQTPAGASDDTYVDRRLFNHILNTSFFVAFFPHLIAGPILKAHSFYPQIGIKRLANVNWPLVFRSLVIGYFLKMVVADNLKDYTFWIAYPYYETLGTITGLVLLFGYSVQIFADFAGYSLIAIGLAASLGYELINNFNFPYISRSIAEFWRRWHISLSTWLREYLYLPLGGNRKGRTRTYFNLITVMVLGGMWHGAAWSYAVWGLFHGIGLAVERMLGLDKQPPADTALPTWRRNLIDSIRVLLVFAFVSVGWVLFKLPNFEHALGFMATLAGNISGRPNLSLIVPVLIFSTPVMLYHLPHFPPLQQPIANLLTGRSVVVRQYAQDLLIGVMLILIVLNSGSSQAFIYFQF